jgi:hypothetical protein
VVRISSSELCSKTSSIHVHLSERDNKFHTNTSLRKTGEEAQVQLSVVNVFLTSLKLSIKGFSKQYVTCSFVALNFCFPLGLSHREGTLYFTVWKECIKWFSEVYNTISPTHSLDHTGVAVTLSRREMLSSNLGWYIAYPDSASIRTMTEYFPLHQSSYHSMSYSLNQRFLIAAIGYFHG